MMIMCIVLYLYVIARVYIHTKVTINYTPRTASDKLYALQLAINKRRDKLCLQPALDSVIFTTAFCSRENIEESKITILKQYQ